MLMGNMSEFRSPECFLLIGKRKAQLAGSGLKRQGHPYMPQGRERKRG